MYRWEYENDHKASSEGVCDNSLCGHVAGSHDMNSGLNGSPCTACDECDDYSNNAEAMISLGDALYHQQKEDGLR